jgi:hypothetical protein
MSDFDSICLVSAYATKASWTVCVNREGLPHVGYQDDYYMKRDVDSGAMRILPPKTNVLLHGSLMLTETARGRSSAHMVLRSTHGWRGHTTLTGAEELFKQLAEGELGIRTGTWTIPQRGIWSDDDAPLRTVTGAVLTGFWTLTKQGTEVSLIPVSYATRSDLMKRIVDISAYLR